ncbi:MAG: tetratricopeptide repeat protein, partial [bacterium]
MKTGNLKPNFGIVQGLAAVLIINGSVACAHEMDNKLISRTPDSFWNVNQNDINHSQYLDESDVYYKKAMERYDAQEYSKALEFMEKALELAPDRNKTRT